MNKREARALVCEVLATTLRNDLENQAGWIFHSPGDATPYGDGGDMRDPSDRGLIEQAIREEIEALEKRAAKEKKREDAR